MPTVPASRMPISAFVLVYRNLRSEDSRSSGGTKPSSSMHVAVTLAIPARLRASGSIS